MDGRNLRRAPDQNHAWLGQAKRIELLGEAWDVIAATPEGVPIPEWHVRELERRFPDPNPEYVSWEDVRARMRRVS